MQVERWPRSVSFITERFKFFHAVGECYPAPSSVPLLARHLLPYWRRLLLSCSFIALDRSCPLSQSATPDSRTQPCPAARPKGKNEESPGWSLLRTERFKFFPATGGGRATPSLIQSTFTSQRSFLWYFLGLQESTVPLVPPLTCTPAASPCEPRSCRRTGKRCRRWTARSADAGPSVRPDKCNPSSGSWPPQWSAVAR